MSESRESKGKKKKNIIRYFLVLRMTRLIPDKIFIKLKYKVAIGKKLNLEKPETFNEKLQWLKLYDRKPEYTKFADKYEVRKYIANVIGEEYLIPVIDVFDCVDQINWGELPNQFVLKCAHGSGSNIICRDKNKLDIGLAEKKLRKWMKYNWYWFGREWQYKNIKPRVICEKYMVDESGTELKDYKFMCFNGKVRCTFVCSNRNTPGGSEIDIYDTDWNLMPFERKNHPNSGKKISKPKEYAKMVEFAEKLTRNMSFARVDFYEINGHLYFGEITFHPDSGFVGFIPESYDYLMGNWIKLPYQ